MHCKYPAIFMIVTSQCGNFPVMLAGFREPPGKVSRSEALQQRVKLGEQESPLLTHVCLARSILWGSVRFHLQKGPTERVNTISKAECLSASKPISHMYLLVHKVPASVSQA